MQNIVLQAWNKTKQSLSKEIKRHLIKSELIHPWKIVGDALKIYEQASQPELSTFMILVSYEELLSSKATPIHSQKLVPHQFFQAISFSCAVLKLKYHQKCFGVIDFVDMRFDYNSQMLLQRICNINQNLVSNYFKMIRHFIMPLQQSFIRTGKINYHSVALVAIPNNIIGKLAYF
ncbi:MAG: hypothetical protein MJK14_17130 [Rivularia sp. ALOHA_DT_140]|nr:hypothetical protein [Rivularia sp. ALOHA_DT_140]